MYAVIMAGGSGTRFWPLSRRARPKQLLAIGTEAPLFVETVERLSPLIPPERVLVATGEAYVEPMRALVPAIPAENMVVEPCARNTAPCVGLAAVHLRHRDRDAVMAVLPADHHIADPDGFRRLVRAAGVRAQAGEIVTLGIRPSRPETGYGYIRYATEGAVSAAGVEVFPVERFVEKPPRARAEQYLEAGNYLWNGGMFFFTAERILADIERFLPDLHAALLEIEAAIGTPEYEEVLTDAFARAPSISLDYGVMEKADAVRVVPADIGWNDVGHWAALADFVIPDAAGNVVRGDAVLIDTAGAIVHAADGRTVAVVGLDDVVVVSTADAVLVCPRDRAQDVRAVVDRLREAERKELL